MTELLEFRTREERKRSKIFEEANQRLLIHEYAAAGVIRSMPIKQSGLLLSW